MTIGRWTIEPSKEGIPLVFGDGKYPHDPPRIASELESALADAYQGTVDLLREARSWVDQGAFEGSTSAAELLKRIDAAL